MKRFLTLFVFLLLGGGLSAQNMSPGVEKIAEQDLNILEMKITRKYPNLKFSDRQKQQLSVVLLERADEIHKLRSTESMTKNEYTEMYNKVEARYNDRIEAILSKEQNVVYQRKARRTLRRGK